MKVLAAMSGGVDSAVAAARAVDAGWDVTGVHLALSRQPATLRAGSRGCCSIEDSHDARRAADVLGIPFYVWDFAERFQAEVIDDFVAEYQAGRTPNPCLRCNEKIKFSALLDRALALGFDAVATGHHAKLDGGELYRSVDRAKDQSYVLAVLNREQLAHAIFPLGDSTKAQVRAEAAQRSLSVADKPDSHDICFIADGDTQGFLARQLGERPGDIVDAEGTVLGSHTGAFGFTVGQRRGLKLSTPAPSGQPRYVLSIQPKSNTVVVGSASDLEVDLIRCTAPVWIGAASSDSAKSDTAKSDTAKSDTAKSDTAKSRAAHSDAADSGVASYDGADSGDSGSLSFSPFDCLVQLRAHGIVSTARIEGGIDESGQAIVTATLREPQRGIAAGQALVMYDGDRVLGSATIVAAERVSIGAR